jgi:virginiamycin B lyase
MIFFLTGIILSFSSFGMKVQVRNELNQPLSKVMMTQSLKELPAPDISDDGYQSPGLPRLVIPELTVFTNQLGEANFPKENKMVTVRLRKFGYKDQIIYPEKNKGFFSTSLKMENDPLKLAQAKPANVWLSALDVGTEEDKIHFKMQCGFCHQQGTEFMRQERSPEEWSEVIQRMIRYGSRLPTDLQKKLPEILSGQYRKLRENPGLLGPGPQFSSPQYRNLEKVTIKEWAVGDSMSQTHDILVSKRGLVYVADNIQDRLYELDPKTNLITVYKVPHFKGDNPGGLISARLREFPKHDSTSNAHSLAESQKDGHIFITPSAQQRLVEFDPETKKFSLHQMDEGFYPHTIRVDQKDNVWFTLALSNQVAKFDRLKKTFKYYDLPVRSFKEKIITQNIKFIFKLMSWGIPLARWLPIDRQSNGVPLAYGIDVTPDGKIWFARLHAKDIGMIDPVTDKITLIPTPFWGPRRLRSDGEGHLWIVSFGDSLLSKYSPVTRKFKNYSLPVVPAGSDTPYSLNVDKKRKIVWVTGNQSDSVYTFDIKREKWRTIPLPRRTTFTRDFEFDPDGNAYTANSNFPSWQIEDTQPTLIKIELN